MSWVYLTIAIVSEVLGTVSLKHSNGMQNWLPNFGVLFFYGLTIYMLSLVVKTIPIGTAYAIWSGMGTAVAVLIGWLLYSERIELSHIVGILCIIVGSLILKNASA